MRITLNFATRPYADLGPTIKRLRIAMAMLAVVAIGLGLVLHAFHSKAAAVRARNHSLDAQIAHLVQERQGYQEMMRQPENAQVLAQVTALNRLFDEKGFSWTLAMEDLETVLPDRVQVSSLEPARSKDGHITLHMRVLGPRDRGLELVSNLEHSKRFFLPRIVGENTESADGPNQKLEPVSASNRVNFDLLADYNPATSEERKAARKAAPLVNHPGDPPAETARAVHPVRVPALHATHMGPPATTPPPKPATGPPPAWTPWQRPARRPARPFGEQARPITSLLKPKPVPGAKQ